jgi:hypothetical protein
MAHHGWILHAKALALELPIQNFLTKLEATHNRIHEIKICWPANC